MKAKSIITEEMFKAAMNSDPIQDDLERCNCERAGELGHLCCGWNYKLNVPMFVDNRE